MIELSKYGSQCRQLATSRLLPSQAVSVDIYPISFGIAGFIAHGHVITWCYSCFACYESSAEKVTWDIVDWK